VPKLQRGRAPGGRGMQQLHYLVNPRGQASTGPRSGGARNLIRQRRRAGEHVASTGPRSGGARNFANLPYDGGISIGFNGAALRGGAE